MSNAQQTAATKLTITVWNRQGASEQHKGTLAECKEWLASTWSDPEDLTAEIADEGIVVARKGFGEATFA